MSLVDCTPKIPDMDLPPRVEQFLEEAERRIAAHQARLRHQPPSGFLSSDYRRAYATLRRLRGPRVGRRFCEWGAGYGVVAALAAMLGYDASGIEAQESLVREGQALMSDFDLPVQLVHGLIVSDSSRDQLRAKTSSFLDLDAPDGFAALRRSPKDFDVTYVYAWPHELSLMLDLFDLQAATGSLLVTVVGDDQFLVYRREAERAVDEGPDLGIE